jgi:hypothetical protein
MKFSNATFGLFLLCTVCACSGGSGGGGSLPSIAGSGGGGGGIVPVPPGGGSSSSPTPQPSASGSPAPGSTPTPAPGASTSPNPGGSPTPVPTGYYASGTVLEAGSGNAVAGAEVVIEPQIVQGATPPANPTASATTAPNGSFTITPLIPGSNYLEIFQSGYATLHQKFNITSFNTQVGPVTLTRLTPDQIAWLTQVNTDRARPSYGASPLVFDETLEEGATHWAAYMGTTGTYQTACPFSDPSCVNAVSYEQSHGGTYTSTGSTIDQKQTPSAWPAAETDIMAQAANCPQPANFSTCPNNANTQKFLNLVNPSFIWVGLAIVPNGKGPSPGFSSDYYDQEFGTPIH